MITGRWPGQKWTNGELVLILDGHIFLFLFFLFSFFFFFFLNIHLFNSSVLELLKNKIQLGKFEDLIGFTKQFMNQSVSHLVSRELQGVVQYGRFL